MPSIFKPTGKSKYEIHYSDHDGRRRKKVLTPDRAISERLAAKLLERVAAIRGGLWTEQDENYADHGRRPIRDHIADYVEHLRSKGSSKHHVSRSKFGIERVCDLAKVKTPGDLSLSRVEAALAEISKSKVASTVNLEIRIFKSFVHWLIEDRRIRDNPLLGLKARREVIKPRLRRR